MTTRPAVDYATAINAAFEAVPGGTLVELRLGDRGDGAVWKVELISPDHVRHVLFIDADSGEEVLQASADDYGCEPP